MNVVAALQADFNGSPLGTRSRLADELRGVTVLRRTVERIRRARRIVDVCVLCPKPMLDRCSRLIEGLGAKVIPYEPARSPWTGLVQTARKWSLDGWRGGLGGTTYFDEFVDARLVAGLLAVVPADAVLCLPAAAPLIDPGLADCMIDHRMAQGENVHMVFAQAPPGFGGVLLDAELVHELASKNHPVGQLLSYKPDSPQKDLIFQPCCLAIPPEIRYAVGRLCADTDRAMARMESLLKDHPDPDAVTAGHWLLHHEETSADSLPREVEIELTTDDPYPDSLIRPRGRRVPRRGPIDRETIGRIADDVSQLDDALLVLGGFGDPLNHPDFAGVLRAIRESPRGGRRVYGVAVRTSGADLMDQHIEAMLEFDVDVMQVTLDAWTEGSYGQLQSPGNPSRAKLGDVIRRMDRFTAARQERGSTRPILLPTMTKTRDNVRELDEFHDGWLRRSGAVCIEGPSHHAEQSPDVSVMSMAPKSRTACRRIRSRCMVLADGCVVMCDQDFCGTHALGRIGQRSLESIWRSDQFERIRTAHRDGRFDVTPLCVACDEWHRP